jgi:uncharacterized protein (TIGR03503 family)
MEKIGSLLTRVLFIVIISTPVQAYTNKVEVEYFKTNNITNEIPYFDNRFKIDAFLDDITLLFYRKSGTQPIILVRPDGSKLKVNNFPKDQVEWFDDKTYDLIRIKKPMPGPWQAIGDILPNSKIMVVSDITIKVDPLPEVILVGETLKVEGRLYNGEQAIDDPLFQDVLTLDVDFFSTNNSAYDNFGAEPVELAQFRDDGHDLDEYAKDNVFTGEFELDFAPGEWVPIYNIKMPMANRELRQKPIVLQKSPINITVDITLDEKKSHKVKFSIDPTFVDPASVLFQGKVTFPDRQVSPFSITEGSGNQRIYDIGFTESGIHRLKVNVFGKTIEGREFRLVLAEYSFNVEHVDDTLLPIAIGENNTKDLSVDQQKLLEIQKAEEEAEKLLLLIEEAKAEQQAAVEKSDKETLFIIIGVNVFIILIAGLIYFFMRRKGDRSI